MVLSPFLSVGFGGWEAFFPVALMSFLGGGICLIGERLSSHMFVGQRTAELVQDLVFADKERRDLVLANLSPIERDWFVAELPRARTELRRRQWQPRADCCAGVRWSWRLRLLNAVANKSL
jgi:hypothetical protein